MATKPRIAAAPRITGRGAAESGAAADEPSHAVKQVCGVAHNERQGSSGCDLNVDSLAFLLCKVINMSHAASLAPHKRRRNHLGPRGWRPPCVASARPRHCALVALGSTPVARGTACHARGRRLWVPWRCMCAHYSTHGQGVGEWSLSGVSCRCTFNNL